VAPLSIALCSIDRGYAPARLSPRLHWWCEDQDPMAAAARRSGRWPSTHRAGRSDADGAPRPEIERSKVNEPQHAAPVLAHAHYRGRDGGRGTRHRTDQPDEGADPGPLVPDERE